MSQRIAVVFVIALGVFLVTGLVLTYIQKARLAANLVGSQNNLRQLSLFAAHHANPNSSPELANKLPSEVPPATIILPGTPPDDRLSWLAPVLPGLDQRRNPVQQLLGEIDVAKPWPAPPNQSAARLRLNVVLCPENTPEPPANSPAITCYVGIAGVGLNAATLEISPQEPTPRKAGAFRYNGPTPFSRITDGLSQTLLMGETAAQPGPWLRGGPSTTRGFDDSAEAAGLIGYGGQFGGFFPNGANFALCDGSVRLFTPETSPSILLRLATIAGGENEVIPE
jgi:prepilin-type processing-associated H-X9-DG protein